MELLFIQRDAHHTVGADRTAPTARDKPDALTQRTPSRGSAVPVRCLMLEGALVRVHAPRLGRSCTSCLTVHRAHDRARDHSPPSPVRRAAYAGWLPWRPLTPLPPGPAARALRALPLERVTGNRGRGQENQNIKLSVWTTAKNSTVLGVSEHAESIG